MNIIALKRGFAGNTVTLAGKDVKFDINGIAEVSDDFGAELVQKYSSMLTYPGQDKQVKPADKPKEMRKTDEEKRLETLLVQYTHKIETLNKEVADLKASEQAWKDIYTKTNEKLEALKKGMFGEKGKEVSPEVSMEQLIETSSFGKLKIICKEMEYPENEWKGFKSREELKDYIKTKYANA